MNNPFTSNRTLFNPASKPNRTNVDHQMTLNSQKSSEINSHNNTNPNTNVNVNRNLSNNGNYQQNNGNAPMSNTASFTSVTFNSSNNNSRNMQNNYNTSTNPPNSNPSSNIPSTQPQKLDLNFRGQFRPNVSPIKTNQDQNNLKKQFPVNFDSSVNTSSMASNLGTSYGNIGNTASQNIQNRVISDTNFSQTKSNNINTNNNINNYNTNPYIQSSHAPSITIPNSSSIASMTPNTNPNTIGASRGSNYPNGVQKQKITFGVASMQENLKDGQPKFQYDRNKFVNRDELFNGGVSALSYGTVSNANSFNQRQSHAISTYKQSIQNSNANHPTNPQPPSQPHPTYNPNTYTSTPNSHSKHISNLTMSPIQQHSKHIMDQPSYQFLDIDAMGDDIGRILASSKNQQELMRLLGIQNKNNNSIQNNVNNVNLGVAVGGSGGTVGGFGKKSTNQLNGSSNSANINNYNQYRYDYDYTQKNKQTEQVFDYQSQIRSKNPQNPTKQPPIPPLTEPHQDSMSNTRRTIKHSNHSPNTQNNDNIANNMPKNTMNSFVNQLQSAIDTEMKRLSIVNNGKVRVFLSATDKIETVKYNLQHI